MSHRQRRHANKAMQIAISRTNNLSQSTEVPDAKVPSTGPAGQRSQPTSISESKIERMIGGGGQRHGEGNRKQHCKSALFFFLGNFITSRKHNQRSQTTQIHLLSLHFDERSLADASAAVFPTGPSTEAKTNKSHLNLNFKLLLH